MKTIRMVVPLSLLMLPTVLYAQSLYMVSKNQFFVQTSAAGAVANPISQFSFKSKTATATTITIPGGSTVVPTADTKDGGFKFVQAFASKEALDVAFPNGTYRMTGASIPALTLNLASDTYPVATPQVVGVTNGTWDSGGLLVVNPAQSTTLNFSTFSGYTTSGIAGHMNFYLTNMSGGDMTALESDIFSVPFGGAAATPTPMTSFTIPAGRLTNGQVYRVWLDFDTIANMDSTTLAGSSVGTIFSKELSFYVSAQSPGTSTPPPVIVVPLTNRVGVIGGSVTFAVDVTIGGTPYSWQNGGNVPLGTVWTHNGQELNDVYGSGSRYTNNTNGIALTISSLTAADAGDYAVTIFTAGGLVMSSPATLSFATPAAPAITTQPGGATVNAGSTVALAVTVSGTPTPTLQWRKDGVPITGATSDSLRLTDVTTTAAGNYTVVATNSLGSVTSDAAAIIITSGQVSRLPNLSVRTGLGVGQTLTVGFATVGAKDMLVRGVGPTLSVFGLNGCLADPTIELYNSASVKIDENNDWSSSLTSVFTSVGAFALAGGSKDAALQRACSGAHTALIKGAGSGVVLVEVYDTGGSGKLVNVSALNAVGTGADILIAGFVVDGTAAKTLLIRGVGAKLAEFGVGGVLADPKLEIYNSAGAKIAENDSWNALLQPVAQSVGAFALTLGSRDTALLLTLAPGAYTAQVSGVGGTTGNAIVEVYEVP